MALDEFYPDDHIDKPIPDSSISRRNIRFFGCYGMQSFKRFNLHFLEESVIIFVTGNTYQIFNLQSKHRQIFHSKDTDGIGSIAVHPSRSYFAVAEKGLSPNIYIYEYPSLRLYRILRKGTDFLFSHIEFSVSGEKLASVGGAPDYTLSVWDWLKERVILKSKAFS
jgi:WD40 repeat protein